MGVITVLVGQRPSASEVDGNRDHCQADDSYRGQSQPRQHRRLDVAGERTPDGDRRRGNSDEEQ